MRCGEIIKKLSDLKDGHDLLDPVILYAASTHDIEADAMRKLFEQAANKKTGELCMNLADRLKAEGEAKGRMEGRIEGERNLLQSQWKQKFPNHPQVDLSGYSQQQLELIGIRLFTCDTPQAVLAELTQEAEPAPPAIQ